MSNSRSDSPASFEIARRRLAAARQAAGLTQEQLAEKADVEKDYIGDMERRRASLYVPGNANAPRDAAKFRRLCLALGVEPAAILKGLL